MSAMGSKLRNIGRSEEYKAFAHFCPGCKEIHVITYKSDHGPVWKWDGNIETPTCQPSIRLFVGDKTICHYFLKAGNIEYCGDCEHELSGKTVPLPDWPHAPGAYGGVED